MAGLYICVDRIKDKNGVYSYYVLKDIAGNYRQIKRENILQMLNQKDIQIVNLVKTVDNKILLKKDYVSKIKKNFIELYHGSPNKEIILQYGKGEDKHDYGKGFYLTKDIELAKEWAVCNGENIGYVHHYYLDISAYSIFDFGKTGVLSWLAELMKHRDADSSARYRKLSKIFIQKYGKDINGYDIIKGWRADSSYFYIAKKFVRDEVDLNILEQLLKLGDLGIQYCLKSERVIKGIKEDKTKLEIVDGKTYKEKYDKRDTIAREEMRLLVENESLNPMIDVFSKLL